MAPETDRPPRGRGSGPSARRRGASRPSSPSTPASRRAPATRASARAATDTLVIDRLCEDAVFAELERAARRRARVHRDLRGARHRHLRRRRPRRACRDRPHRRLAQRAAHRAPATASASPSRRATRWPTSRSATSTSSAPARSSSPSAARGRALDGRADRDRATRRRARGGGDGGEQARAGDRPRARLSTAAPTGSAARARSPSPLCYVAAGRFDGMLTTRALPLGGRRGSAAHRPRGGRRGQLRRLASSATLRSAWTPATESPPRAPSATWRRCCEAQDGSLSDAPQVDVGTGLGRAHRARPRGRRSALGRHRGRAARGVAARARSSSARYTGLRARGRLPDAELIGRDEWAQVNLASFRDMSGAGRGEAGRARCARPGRSGASASASPRAAAGAEVGLAVGYLAQRVVGQYDVALIGPAREPRLLFVGPNLSAARERLDVDRDLFLRWIALHETTHAVQFAGGALAARRTSAGSPRSCSSRPRSRSSPASCWASSRG